MKPNIHDLVDVSRIDRTLDDIMVMTPGQLASLPATTFHKMIHAMDNVAKAIQLLDNAKKARGATNTKDISGMSIDDLLREVSDIVTSVDISEK